MRGLLLLISGLLLLASCSTRYGHIPKAKKKSAAKLRQHYKKNKTPLILLKPIKAKIAVTDTVKPIPITIKKLPSIPLLSKKVNISPIEKSTKNTPLTKKNTQNKTNTNKTYSNKKQQSDFWEDFWEDILFDILFAVICVLLLLLVNWLIEIGLGWLVLIIGIAIGIFLLIVIIKTLSDLFTTIMDGIFG